MPNNITILGFAPLAARLKKLTKAVTIEFDAELGAGADSVMNLAKRRAPVYEGKLRNSIESDTNTPFLKKVTANQFYAPFIEFGTKKKVKVPSGLETYASQFKKKLNKGNFDTFVDSIQAWMKRKGIKAATQIEFKKGKAKKRSSLSQAIAERQLAIHIATRILQNGINPQPFFFNSFADETPKIISRIKKVIDL